MRFFAPFVPKAPETPGAATPPTSAGPAATNAFNDPLTALQKQMADMQRQLAALAAAGRDSSKDS